ncbi:uncharacterized protein QC763_0078680 [Podospora pseudopauciseta]|uniref:Uncharacterized protein n=1 Tax=Podospora pseudopauciseta TaxID=2093780 RepID=A0ABR0HAY4_9PEZI|nr:hypothetical protein QC763_0078680 [Podospora pseudopauciseta]
MSSHRGSQGTDGQLKTQGPCMLLEPFLPKRCTVDQLLVLLIPIRLPSLDIPRPNERADPRTQLVDIMVSNLGSGRNHIETNEHLPLSGSACTGASGNRGADCPSVVARQLDRPIAGKVASEDNVARVPKCPELKFHHEFGVGKVA